MSYVDLTLDPAHRPADQRLRELRPRSPSVNAGTGVVSLSIDPLGTVASDWTVWCDLEFD